MGLLLVLLHISGETVAVELVPVWLVLNWLGINAAINAYLQAIASGDSVYAH